MASALALRAMTDTAPLRNARMRSPSDASSKRSATGAREVDEEAASVCRAFSPPSLTASPHKSTRSGADAVTAATRFAVFADSAATRWRFRYRHTASSSGSPVPTRRSVGRKSSIDTSTGALSSISFTKARFVPWAAPNVVGSKMHCH